MRELEAWKVGSGGRPPRPSSPSTVSEPAMLVSASTHEGRRAMPERPVPTSSPTVLITMPEEVQLKAIQYMAAMQAPRRRANAPADPNCVRQNKSPISYEAPGRRTSFRADVASTFFSTRGAMRRYREKRLPIEPAPPSRRFCRPRVECFVFNVAPTAPRSVPAKHARRQRRPLHAQVARPALLPDEVLAK